MGFPQCWGLKGRSTHHWRLLSPPQYQELQASAQLHGDSMKETKVQMSQLQQAIKRLQSQIVSLKEQVGLPGPPLSPGPRRSLARLSWVVGRFGTRMGLGWRDPQHILWDEFSLLL